MDDPKPSTEPLERSLQRLLKGLERYQADTSDELVSDGLVHRFKLTHDLSRKTLKRYLLLASHSPVEITDMDFEDLIMAGNKYGVLLGEATDWEYYSSLRNKTGYAYNQGVALAVAEVVPKFAGEVSYMLQRLQRLD